MAMWDHAMGLWQNRLQMRLLVRMHPAVCRSSEELLSRGGAALSCRAGAHVLLNSLGLCSSKGTAICISKSDCTDWTAWQCLCFDPSTIRIPAATDCPSRRFL